MNEQCRQQPADRDALLNSVVEIEIGSSTKLARVALGQCYITLEVVFHDLGNDGADKTMPEDIIHGIRLEGLETVSIDLDTLSDAAPAPLVVTDAMRLLSQEQD